MKRTMKTRNLAAKYARTYNKASVFIDQKKAAKKGKQKHKPNYKAGKDSGFFLACVLPFSPYI